MLQVVPPRIWLPTMQIVWGILTMWYVSSHRSRTNSYHLFHSTSAVSNVQQIYAIRFLQGISESSTFVGTHYILGA